jgi:hypothetical protein
MALFLRCGCASVRKTKVVENQLTLVSCFCFALLSLKPCSDTRLRGTKRSEFGQTRLGDASCLSPLSFAAPART